MEYCGYRGKRFLNIVKLLNIIIILNSKVQVYNKDIVGIVNEGECPENFYEPDR